MSKLAKGIASLHEAHTLLEEAVAEEEVTENRAALIEELVEALETGEEVSREVQSMESVSNLADGTMDLEEFEA